MEELLPQSEKPMILFRIRKSRWFLLGPLSLVGLGALMLITLFSYLATNGGLSGGLIFVGIVIILIVFAGAALVVIVDWLTTFYVLTTHTIEVVREFYDYSRTYVSLHDLSRVECKSGMRGHLFNYGTVTVESETTERPLVFTGVSSPQNVADLIRQARGHVAGTDK